MITPHNGRKTPRRPRWPAINNTFAVAQDNASKLQASDIKKILETINLSAKALREGVATELQWSIVAGAIDLANAIERQGIVRGMHEHLASADAALKSIHARATAAGPWKPATLHYFEIDTMSEFVNLHAFQLKQLSLAEYKRAVANAAGNIRGAGNHVTVNKIRDFAGAAA